jgi:predicted molibdopterin-dependent oxidoreductase YjgC
VAVFVSPRLTNEEVYLAQKLARVALRTNNVTSFSRLVNASLEAPDVVSTASVADVADAQALLVVNAAPDETAFSIDLACKRALRNGARLVYVGPEENRTSRFAEHHLRCLPGGQAFVLLALLKEYAALRPDVFEGRPDLAGTVAGFPAARLEELTGVGAARVREAAVLLAGSILKVMLLDEDYRGRRRAGDHRLIARAGEALGCGLLVLREKANARGLLDLGADPRWLPGYVDPSDREALERVERELGIVLGDLPPGNPDVAGLLRRKEVKVALVLGENPLGAPGYPRDLCEGLLAADFLLVGDLFLTPTAANAGVVLPLSSTAETSGTMTNAEGRVQALQRAVPPLAGLETWEILSRLGGLLGFRFKMRYASVADVTAEIRRVAPPWHGLGPDLGGFVRETRSVPGVVPPPALPGDLVTPAPTLFLDTLEMRFQDWFDGLVAKARRDLPVA